MVLTRMPRDWISSCSGMHLSRPIDGLKILVFGTKHAFENLEESAKDGIVDELLKKGTQVFGEVAKNQWGSYCIQHSEYMLPSLG